MATNKIRKAVVARHTSAPAFWWRKITRARSVGIDGFTVEVDQERIGYTATKALWRGTYEEAAVAALLIVALGLLPVIVLARVSRARPGENVWL